MTREEAVAIMNKRGLFGGSLASTVRITLAGAYNHPSMEGTPEHKAALFLASEFGFSRYGNAKKAKDSGFPGQVTEIGGVEKVSRDAAHRALDHILAKDAAPEIGEYKGYKFKQDGYAVRVYKDGKRVDGGMSLSSVERAKQFVDNHAVSSKLSKSKISAKDLKVGDTIILWDGAARKIIKLEKGPKEIVVNNLVVYTPNQKVTIGS